MKDELKEIAVSITILIAGIWARAFLGNKRFNIYEIVAFVSVGIALVLILNESSLSSFYQKIVTLVYGLIAPPLLRAIIRGSDNAEDSTARKVERYINKKTDI